jgi:hypothetical protein
VQSSPGAGGEDAGVDLQVQVPVRVAGAGGVVPHDGGLEPLDGDLDLAAARADPGGGVLGEPGDDLAGRAVLGGVVCGGHRWVHRRGEGPALGSVDDDLDEPQGVVVLAEPALREAGGDVVAGDPALVGRPVELAGVRDRDAVGAADGDDVGGEAGAFGEVVVVDPGAVGFDVVARRGGVAAVELDPAVHLVTARHYSSITL